MSNQPAFFVLDDPRFFHFPPALRSRVTLTRLAAGRMRPFTTSFCPWISRLSRTFALTLDCTHTVTGADEVAVYLEVDAERVTLYVRDRGDGFELDAVPSDRKGVSESIVGRMHRHGGVATIHTAIGAGTEVELELPRARPGAPAATEPVPR